LDGATVERRDLVLEEASKVDAEWFGLARDPEPGSTWVEASGLALWNLSSGDRLAQFPNPQDVSIVGKRWIVACAGSPSDGATERYLVHELKTGRVASSFAVPSDAFVLGATDAAMFFATGTTLLAVRLGGGAPQAVGGPRRQWGASNRSCAQDGDHLFVTAVEGDGSHSVLRIGPSDDPSIDSRTTNATHTRSNMQPASLWAWNASASPESPAPSRARSTSSATGGRR
jgi:hypothetical protein